MFRLKLSDGSTFGSFTSSKAAKSELAARRNKSWRGAGVNPWRADGWQALAVCGRVERHLGKGVWAAVTAIAMLLAPVVANAATTDGKGRKVEWTADRYAREQQLQCTYGAPRFETDAHGRTIIVTSKICKGASR